MMSPDDLRAAAEHLWAAERTRTQMPLLSDSFPGIDMDDAYAIQAEFVRLKRMAGDKVIGWKIGLTSKAMQAALAIDIPDSGVLLESMAFGNGATIPADRFIQPRVEAELAFVMKAPLSGVGLSPGQILDATDYVVPSLEILDTRILRRNPETGRTRTVFDTISDNAANAGIVVGTPIHDFRFHDLRWIGAIVTRDGVVEETGLGAGVLGDPLMSVSWLVDRLASYGDLVEANQLVLSGSFIRPIEAPSGSHIVADFGPFGRVECRFA